MKKIGYVAKCLLDVKTIFGELHTLKYANAVYAELPSYEEIIANLDFTDVSPFSKAVPLKVSKGEILVFEVVCLNGYDLEAAGEAVKTYALESIELDAINEYLVLNEV